MSPRARHDRLARWVATAGFVLATPADAQYTLVWEDEFDGIALDPAKWEAQIGDGCPSLCGWGNNELQYYRAENATVADGLLTITAREEAFGGRDYTSARLRTLGLGDWTYGRFEMRARMPIGQGLWPAFWLLHSDTTYGIWPASGEIDIMEYLGQEPTEVFGTIHYGGPDPVFASTGTQLAGGTFHDDFHTFAVEWDPTEIRWYVDGEQYACNSHWWSAGGPYPAPFDHDFHLILNLAVGGNLPGAPDGTTEFPQELVVDWVRVYQKPQAAITTLLFDGMDHADPFGNDWFVFSGIGGGGIGATTSDVDPTIGCRAALESGWGGGAGFIGGFGRTFPLDLTTPGMTHFTFWINPDADQRYTLEINLQDDDDGDDRIPPTPNGGDDEFQFEVEVGPEGPVVAGGGWQEVSIPLVDFTDDDSFHYGGNGILDPEAVSAGGNGRLINVVFAIVSPEGGAQTFRTDRWAFDDRGVLSAGAPATEVVPAIGIAAPSPFRAHDVIRLEIAEGMPVTLSIVDVSGRRVRSLVDGSLSAGTHAVSWDGRTSRGRAAPAGVYFVRVEAAAGVRGHRLVFQP